LKDLHWERSLHDYTIMSVRAKIQNVASNEGIAIEPELPSLEEQPGPRHELGQEAKVGAVEFNVAPNWDAAYTPRVSLPQMPLNVGKDPSLGAVHKNTLSFSFTVSAVDMQAGALLTINPGLFLEAAKLPVLANNLCPKESEETT